VTGVTPTPDPHSAAIPEPPSVTVVIPMYNEVATIGELLRRLMQVSMPCESQVVVVDDASSDGSPAQVDPYVNDPSWPIELIRLPVNGGKGNAIAAGVAAARTTHVVVLDADLELAPEDLPNVVAPIALGRADAVVGIRVSSRSTPRRNAARRALIYGTANRGITTAFNLAHGSRLHDVMNGYKVLPVSTYHTLDLKQAGFAIEIELAAGMLNRGLRVAEVPVSYLPRGKKEGKKIRARDTIAVFRAIVATRRGSRGR
jgi:glycosyltransferase involved in cell wall biosynthesis